MSLKSEERECEDVKSVAIVRAPTYFALRFASLARFVTKILSPLRIGGSLFDLADD